jgi:predicted Zn finger-like uncharacterized protein
VEIVCKECGAKNVLDDSQLGGHDKVQFRCAKCDKVIVVDLKYRPDRTRSVTPLPSFARSEMLPEVKAELYKEPPGLALPTGKEITVRAISGPAAGLTHKVTKPRIIFGRAGSEADIEVDDPEVSRWHCALEVKQDAIWLRDLESTNGTYFDEERTRAALIMDGAQFRIGSTVFQVDVKLRPA